LATIPSKEELISKLLYLLKFPIQGTASVLDKIREKKEKETT
jgi:ribosomal protein L10